MVAEGKRADDTDDVLREGRRVSRDPTADRIRMLHFSDLHIGVEDYGGTDPGTGVSGRVMDFLRRFDELIDYGLAHEVDLVVFAGDAYKAHSPNPTFQRAFASRVKRLADAGTPVVLLVGSHDSPARSERATSVDIFSTLDVPNIIVGRDCRVHTVTTPRGTVQVATVPYPTRDRLLTADISRDLSPEEMDQAVGRMVASAIQDLRESLDPNLPAVLAAHLTVSGAAHGSERRLMLGWDPVVSRTALDDPAWDYVALGHMHKHQSLNGESEPPIVYAGGLERIDFCEEGEPKGFCWVELPRESSSAGTAWTFVEVDARRYVSIHADVRRAEDPLDALKREIEDEEIDDAVVRLILELDADQASALRDGDVRALLSKAYAIRGISRHVERRARVRLGDQPPEEMTDRELLTAFLEARNVPPERITALLERADPMLDGEDDG